MLYVSGLLVETFGGPSVKPYQPEGLWTELAGGAGQGKYVPSTGADAYRRSVYTYRKRTVPHPSLTTFDAPGFEQCTARRPRTNTPLQALALLNDPTYIDAAWGLATAMINGATADDRRLAFGVRTVLGRRVTEAELVVLRRALARHREDFEADTAAAVRLLDVGESPLPESLRTPEMASWTMIASTLLNLDETVTKR